MFFCRLVYVKYPAEGPETALRVDPITYLLRYRQGTIFDLCTVVRWSATGNQGTQHACTMPLTGADPARTLTTHPGPIRQRSGTAHAYAADY